MTISEAETTFNHTKQNEKENRYHLNYTRCTLSSHVLRSIHDGFKTSNVRHDEYTAYGLSDRQPAIIDMENRKRMLLIQHPFFLRLVFSKLELVCINPVEAGQHFTGSQHQSKIFTITFCSRSDSAKF
jgi:hypothetical protein